MPSGYPIPKNRRCYSCGFPKTYRRKNGQPVWHSVPDHPGEYNCQYCWHKTTPTLEYFKIYNKKWCSDHYEYHRKYSNEYIKQWYKDNPGKASEYYMRNYYSYGWQQKKKEYYKKNRDMILARKAMRKHDTKTK